MKYNNFTDSPDLPIRAFQPRGGRGPFSYGMTLEGGGGGGVIGGIVDAVSDVVQGVGDVIGDVAQGIGDVGVAIDKGVNDVVPGGWVTVGTVALMVAAPYAAPYLAAEAGAAAAATEAAALLEAAAIAEGATTAGMVAGTSSAAASTSAQAALQAAAVNAAKGAAINSATQLVTTGNLDPDQAIKAGVTGGVMGGLGTTLNTYGANPMIAGGISGTTGGALNAAMNDRDIATGALRGAIGGTAGGATSMIGREFGLDPYSQGALSGATSGMTSAALNNQDILTGGLTGAAVGTAGVAGRQLGTMFENELTGDADRSTFTGDVLGSLARSETRDLLTEDQDPRMRQPMPRTRLAGAPSQVNYAQPSGALPRNPQAGQMNAFTPRMSAAGAPMFGNESSSSSLIGQTGLPTMAATTSNTSDVALVGGAAGVPTGSSPNANVGNVTGLFPSSGLNASGLPAPLASGVLTSQAMYEPADSPKMNQLKQLYPQLQNVDPRILASITSDGPAAGYAMGGSVRMNKGGNPRDILERYRKAQEDYEFSQSDRGFRMAAQSLSPPNQDRFAARVPYGDPSSNYNRPISSQYFVNRAKGGTVDHKPEFITGATGHFVQGRGDGQSDDIPAMLADGEYVFDADTVAALGNGSSKAGALQLDKMREAIRKHKRSAPHDKIPPKAKSPLQYLKGKA